MPIWSMAPATTRTVCHQARHHLSRVVDCSAVDTPAAGAKDALNAKDAKAIDPALAAKMKADSLAKAAALAQTDSATQPVDSAALASAMEKLNVKDLWKPVVKELQAFGGANDIANHSLFYIFFIGFVGGLLALVMPCIWPIIPMTVSFFLKRAKNDKKKVSAMRLLMV